jgi:hypothetical protein
MLMLIETFGPGLAAELSTDAMEEEDKGKPQIGNRKQNPDNHFQSICLQ